MAMDAREAHKKSKVYAQPQVPINAFQLEESFKDGAREFMQKVAVAQTKELPDRWIEATPEIAQLFQPSGFGEAGYFWYQNVKVYEVGKKEACDKRDRMTREEIDFPKRSGAV